MFTNKDCTILCSNCETPLAEVWIKENGAEKSSIKVECGHCGDSSFIKNVSGKFYIGSTEQTTINDIQVSENVEGVKISTIKTTKVEKHRHGK
tara:strand:+ start:454 stop:732 length:279 start_codon:yes stop_codon:yes gene_type:complete